MRVLLCLGAIAVAVALTIVPGTIAQAVDDGPEEIFLKAARAQKEGQFEEAAERYRSLIQSGYAGGHLLYNLGNAHIRLNQLGMAILQYERARQLIPRDADLHYNLQYARNLTLDAIPASKGFIGNTLFWLDSFNCNELFWTFAALNLLFWTVLLVRLFYRSEWFYYLFVLVLLCWFISGLSFGAKWRQVQYDDRAVILKKEVSILAGPHQGDTVLFKLHEGAIVNEERVDGEWMLIHLPDRKRGWIQSEDAARVREQAENSGQKTESSRQ